MLVSESFSHYHITKTQPLQNHGCESVKKNVHRRYIPCINHPEMNLQLWVYPCNLYSNKMDTSITMCMFKSKIDIWYKYKYIYINIKGWINSITLDPKTRIQNNILGSVLILKSSISPADRRTSTVPDFYGKLANVDDLNWKFTGERMVKLQWKSPQNIGEHFFWWTWKISKTLGVKLDYIYVHISKVQRWN